MDNSNIFNSKEEAIPSIREELDIIPVEENGNKYLYFHDMMGYATPNLALDRQVTALLSMLDGNNSIEDLSPYLGEQVSSDQLLEYIQFLDKNRLLHSKFYKNHAEAVEQEYERSDVHRPVSAGLSYPADSRELNSFLNKAFSKKVSATGGGKHIKALYAPHIDPRVGMDEYVKAFSSIKDIKPKRVVILATSHYASLHPDTYANKPFIVSNKTYEMPLGNIATDKGAVELLLNEDSEIGITGKDRAHRVEHSIELHLLFLSYLWDHDFRIVPILVDGLDDLFYMENGFRSRQVNEFGKLLNTHFSGDDETFFLISGDLSHIGKKFGDEKSANELLNEVKSFDRMLLEYAEQGKEDKLLKLLKEDFDPYRICGYPPLYTFLKAADGIKGQTISYDLWNETERESAVTFGSILYTSDS